MFFFLYFAQTQFQPEELKDMMHVAIINDRVSFVRLFLENGVSLREFLTADDKVDTYLI